MPYAAQRIRQQMHRFRIERMYRVIHQRHRHKPLGVLPTPSRFSDPEGNFAVLYAASAVRCCFWEAVVRNRLTHRRRRQVSRVDVVSKLVVTLESRENLALVDLREDGPVQIGAPTAVAHGSNHAAGRSLSAAAHALVPEADGFLYHSRFTGHLCTAIFGRAARKLEVLNVSALIEHADFLDALDFYDITLTAPS